jgi:hypothetical protein
MIVAQYFFGLIEGQETLAGLITELNPDRVGSA